MKLKLACADFTFPLLPHDHALQLIAILGIEGVDVGLFEGRGHLWPSREFTDIAGSARKLKSKMDARGLVAADIFLQLAPDHMSYAPNHPNASRRRKAREWFSMSLDYAAECGCGHVTSLPGVHFEEEPYDDSLARSVDELGWRVERAQEHDITFGVEAHIGSIVAPPKAAEKLIRSVPGLTLTLDYGHFIRVGLPDSAVEPLVQYASHFHARGAREGRLQESFAHNTIDFARVVEVMEVTDYSGWIGLEYVWTEWERCDECDNLSETILLRDFFRSLSR
jgi:sugar phosphate isomerase/epimerase